MESGILYALVAGLFWGTSPVLVKRGLAGADVSAATLYQQATILLTLFLSALLEGDLFSGKIPSVAVLIFAGTGVVGAYLGRTLFVRSVDQIGASRAQSLNNSSPLITVLLAAAVLGALVMHATGLALLMTLGNLLKIERKWQRIPTNSAICFVAAGFLYAIGSIFTLKALVHVPASVVAPIWSAQPIVSFFLAKTTLKGIEEVTIKDGAAAALVVVGVLVLRWG
jgi:drug/metabolite transporter (DMT)-like permease